MKWVSQNYQFIKMERRQSSREYRGWPRESRLGRALRQRVPPPASHSHYCCSLSHPENNEPQFLWNYPAGIQGHRARTVLRNSRCHPTEGPGPSANTSQRQEQVNSTVPRNLISLILRGAQPLWRWCLWDLCRLYLVRFQCWASVVAAGPLFLSLSCFQHSHTPAKLLPTL